MEITYESIKSIILEENVEGYMMQCKFKVEDEVFEAQSSIRKDTKDTAQQVKGIVRANLFSKLRTAVSQVVRKVLGGGIQGNIGQQVTNTMVAKHTNAPSFSRKEKEDAVVECFKKVSLNLFFNQEEGRWAINRKLSDFEKRLLQAPISKAYDKKVLARMLIEIAKVDGSIEQEEKEFFQDFLSAETGTFAELMRMPPLSRVECEEVTKEAKENVFMITCALAISDHDFDSKERTRLYEYAAMLGLKDDARDNMLRAAQDYTIETIVTSEGEMERDDLYEFADGIGMDRGEAERAQVKFSKRLN